jgi:succinoglycan biosynthesis transport protein ExoP
MEEHVLTPGDYLAILNRRKWALLVPFFLIAVASVMAAMLLPPVYKSTATILIEKREIPAKYVTSSMTTFAEQRMQSIRQRVLTSRQLQALIKQFGLYGKLQKKQTMDEILAKMRSQISLNPVNVEVTDQRSRRPATATIAFTLSYEGDNPQKVQQVVNTISTLFLKEDLKGRTAQASSTHEFLKKEKEKIDVRLVKYEQQLAAYKKKHVNSLPELFQVNMQSLNTIERNIELSKENLRTLKEKKEELGEQLSNTIIDLEDSMVVGGRKDADEIRLESLKMELINLKTKFSNLYPDVKKLQQEIKKLEAKVEAKRTGAEATEIGTRTRTRKNPAYITLSSRLAGIKSDIGSVKNQIRDLEDQAEEYRARIAATPDVEGKYNAILAERKNLTARQMEMQAKMMDANVAQALESQQKGERFTLIESASFPGKPFKPNRMAIVLIGIVLGIGAGVGFASIIEFSDTSFRGPEALERDMGFPVLTSIQRIVTRQERFRARTFKIFGAATTLAAMVVLVVLFDNYVLDLDVLWTKIMRKI